MAAKTTAFLLALLGLCAALFPALSAPVDADDGTYPVILKSMNITTIVDNAYAVTEISQTFENTVNETAEAFFGVMIPEKAFISNFSLSLENGTYYADVLPKEEAQDKYTESVASGKNAGIGQTRDTNYFTFAVNLKGEQEATIALRYEQYLPMYLGERRCELFLSEMDVSAAEFSLNIDISSAPGLSGCTVENYESSITREWDTSHNVVLSMEKQDFRPDSDLTVVYRESPVPVNGSLLGHYDSDSGEYYFMNIFSPMKSEVGGSISKDVVFVLDKSGSMNGEKIEQLKAAFKVIIEQLPDDDRFDIIMFDSNIEVYKPELIYATQSNRDEALEYLKGVNAGGSTNLYDGLEKALDMLTNSEARAPIIVMLTDGQANAGKYESSVPIREHIAGMNNIFCPIFTLGFGDNVDFDFLSALSLENYARAQRIHPGEDAGEQIVNFYDTISTTLLKKVEICYPDAAHDYFPGSIPAVYEGSESIIVGKMALNETDGTFTTGFSASSAEGKREFIASYDVSDTDTGNEGIKRFWAYAKIYDLMDGLVLMSGQERDEAISEIEKLSIEAHFVTPYTALYLGIEEEEAETDDTDFMDETGETFQVSLDSSDSTETSVLSGVDLSSGTASVSQTTGTEVSIDIVDSGTTSEEHADYICDKKQTGDANDEMPILWIGLILITTIIIGGAFTAFTYGGALTGKYIVEIVDVTVDPEDPTEGEETNISVQINNIGKEFLPDENEVLVTFYDGYDTIEEEFVDLTEGLLSGESIVVSTTAWDPVAGDHTLNITIEVDGEERDIITKNDVVVVEGR